MKLKLEGQMLRDDWEVINNRVAKLVARSWLDERQRQAFISDPKAYLEAQGIVFPRNVQVRVDQLSYRWRIEPSDDFNTVIYTIGLPPKPSSTNEEQIQGFLATEGGNFETMGGACCCC